MLKDEFEVIQVDADEFYQSQFIDLLWQYADEQLKAEEISQFLLEESKLLSVGLDITDACNLNCPFCYYRTRGSNNVDAPAWIKVINDLDKMGVRSIAIAGKEPFTAPETVKILHHLSSKTQHIRTGIVTNGTLLDRYLKELQGVQLDYLDISVDGLEQTHDRWRGKGVFSKVVHNIERLLSAPIARRIFVVSILSRQNYQELPLLIDFFNKRGVRNFCFGLYVPTPGLDNTKWMITENALLKFWQELRRKAERCAKGTRLMLEISGNDLAYLPLLIRAVMIDFDQLEMNDVGDIYVQEEIGNSELIIQVLPFFNYEVFRFIRVKQGHILPACEAFTKEEWRQYSVGSAFEEPIDVLYQRLKQKYIPQIIKRMENSTCKNKWCFPYCFGGNHIYNIIIDYKGYDYVCELIPESG